MRVEVRLPTVGSPQTLRKRDPHWEEEVVVVLYSVGLAFSASKKICMRLTICNGCIFMSDSTSTAFMHTMNSAPSLFCCDEIPLYLSVSLYFSYFKNLWLSSINNCTILSLFCFLPSPSPKGVVCYGRPYI